MKKLLMTLAASVTTVVASAAIKSSEGFESGLGGFLGDGDVVAYGQDDAAAPLNYPFSGVNTQYCSISDTLESPRVEGAKYFDMYVQFPESTGTPSLDALGADTKVAVYLDSSNKVCVVSKNKDIRTSDIEVIPGTWVRLTIAKVNNGNSIVYSVSINGESIDTFDPISDGEPTKVEFTGSGKLDNFVARTTDPFYSGAYAASVGTGDDNEKFATYSDALADVLASGATATITIPGETTKTLDGTAEHPFEIKTADDLKALADAVNAGKSAGKCFVQTANIDMAGADAFAGIGVYDANPTNGVPFAGTYDGGNFKICNVDFTQRNYGGVFNQVNGGTIKNLTVSNITCSAFSDSVNSGEWGGAIVGNAGNGATLQNLVAEGSFAADHPATHNVAGIVIRACGGGENGTLIKDCTNNATLYGAYTKIGGICAITQYKIAGGAVTFDGCVNNGDIISSRTTATGVTGYAGILGYNDDNTVIVNCSNTGSIVNESGANTDKDGAIVGWAYTKDAKGVRSLTDQGGNSAAKTDKMLAFVSNLADVTGFKYATVANDVATTVTSLSAGNTYLLEGNVAASETPVFTFAEAGTIAFDAALGYTFEGTVAAASSLELGTTTAGSVTTYTAFAPVAAIGETKYPTLGAAVAAATDGATVTVLANTSGFVGENVNDITLDLAGCTITGDDAIKWTGSGKLTIVDSVGGGQAIGTAADGCAIWVAGGSVAVQAGYFQNNSEEEATIYVGVAGASATITGGTFRNLTQDYKWAGSDFDYYCLNVGNNLSATAIQVSGGSFSHDPAKGDDRLGSLLASGYESAYDELTGYWVVSEKEDTGIDPTVGEASYDTKEDAQAATVAVPEGIEVAPAVYDGYFKKTVNYNEETSKWVVTAELDATKVLPVEESAAETAMLEDLKAVATGTEATATVPTKPGLFYWIAGAGEVNAVNYTNGAAQPGDGTAKELAKPVLTGLNGKAFYKVCVDIKDPAKQ